ncbi:MAG: hypothetical protein JST91_00815 [Actinobacteria bacterium]|nr:hypothetical protein [Actinomycetota bacterium]
MIDQTAQLHELPDYWQAQIRKLRSENYELRSRLKGNGIRASADLDELPNYWRKTIVDLRKENGRYRTDRRELQIEVEALRAELGAQDK